MVGVDGSLNIAFHLTWEELEPHLHKDNTFPTIESVPAGGLNLMVVPTGPVPPKVLEVVLKPDDPKRVLPDGAA